MPFDWIEISAQGERRKGKLLNQRNGNDQSGKNGTLLYKAPSHVACFRDSVHANEYTDARPPKPADFSGFPVPFQKVGSDLLVPKPPAQSTKSLGGKAVVAVPCGLQLRLTEGGG